MANRHWRGRTFVQALFALAVLLLGAGLPSAQTRPPGALRLDQIVPQSAAIGTDGVTITLAGRGFRQGDELLSQNPSIVVLSFSVVSPTTATATLRILPGATPGPARLDIRGYDHSTAYQVPAPPPLLLYPSGGIAAPLAVRDAAVVSPMPGTLLAPDHPVFARGLLATSGTGTVIGAFLLDGVPFDQFTVVATGGEPVPVKAKVPIPYTYTGTHDLRIRIYYPQHFLSGAVRIVGTPDSRTSLKLIDPPDGAVVTSPPALRWTLVPGTLRYEVLWLPPGSNTAMPFSAGGDTWTPDGSQLAQMGTGEGRWSVRPVFAGNVTGVQAPWRRLTLTGNGIILAFSPQENGSLPGSVRLSWSGAPSGVLYLLEFFKPGEQGVPVFRAQTRTASYTLRRFPGSGPLEVTVTPLSSNGTRLGKPARSKVSPPSEQSRSFAEGPSAQYAAGPPVVQGTTPARDSTVSTAQPPIGARWSGSIPSDDIVIFLDNTDVTAMADMGMGRFVYTPLMPLQAGPHTVKLSLGGTDYEWTFTIESTSEGPAAKGGGPTVESGKTAGKETPRSKPSGGWTAEAAGTLTEISGSGPDQKDTARFTLSSQSDLGSQGWFFQDTVDASFRHDFPDPRVTVNESRNWLIQGGYEGNSWGWKAQAGYAAPDFLGASQLVSSGLVRGGGLANLDTPGGKVGLYGSFDNSVPGLGSGTGAGDIRVRAASYLFPLPDDRFGIRLVGLWTDQDSSATVRGGSGRVFGVIASLHFSPGFGVDLEAAQGRNHPDGQDAYQGNGYRLGFSGSVSGTQYQLNLRRVASSFANPANPGYTQGGVPDRTGGDLRVSHAFGKVVTTFAFANMKTVGGDHSEAPDGRLTDASLNLSLPLNDAVFFTTTLNSTWTRQGQDHTNHLPGMKRDQYGLTLSAVEQFGKLSFSQTYTGQRTRDDLHPLARNTISSFALTLGGELVRNFGIAATGAFTRTWAAGPAGRTDLAVISLSPYWTLPDLHLTVTPRVSYTRNLSDTGTVDSHSEQYQLCLGWNPTWGHSLLSLQGSAEYDRNADAVTLLPVTSSHRYTLSLVLRWGGGSGTLNEPYTQAVGTQPYMPPLQGLGGNGQRI